MRNTFALIAVVVFLTPAVASAQTLVSLLVGFQSFINSALIPFIFAVAFVYFLWAIFSYFIFRSDNEMYREKARTYAIWAITAFVIMVSIWGIVNLLVSGLDIDRNTFVCPDYLSPSECKDVGSRGVDIHEGIPR